MIRRRDNDLVERVFDHTLLSTMYAGTSLFQRENDYGTRGVLLGSDSIERVEMSSSVKSRFYAIDMALRMLGEPHPDSWVFQSTDPSNENSEITIPLYRNHRVPIVAPCLIWRFGNYTSIVHYVLKIGKGGVLSSAMRVDVPVIGSEKVEEVLDSDDRMIESLERDLRILGGGES